MSKKVLVVGDNCLDIIFTGLPSKPVLGEEIFAEAASVTVGGGTYPTAMVLRRLGLESDIFTQFGNDFFSRYAIHILTEEGFDPAIFIKEDQPLRRMTVALSYPEDRAFISIQDPAPKNATGDRFGPAPLKKRKYDHVHIAHLSAGLDARRLIAEAKRQGVTVSLDCGWKLKAIHNPSVWQTLRSVDIFLPNEKEAQEITGEASLSSVYHILAKNISTTVVKLGDQGAVAIQGEKCINVPTISVKPVETTAAGDCFNAGFIYGYVNKYPLRDSVLAGNICGALSVTAPSWENAPNQNKLDRVLRRMKSEEL